MRKVICHHCHEKQQVPDDLAQAKCGRCGQVLALETSITAHPSATSRAIQPEGDVERWSGSTGAIDLPERYASWEEFRSLSPAVQRVWTDLATQPLPDLRHAETRSLPANTPARADDLGPPLASFATPGDIRLAVHFLSFSVVATGLLMAYMIVDGVLTRANRDLSLGSAILYSSLCVVASLPFGYWISFWRDPNYPVTYWILENGILWRRGGALEACRWEDIQSLDFHYRPGHMRLSVQLAPDFKPTISTASKPNWLELLEFVATKATAAQFLPCLRRIFDGERIKFGALWLDRAGIGGPIIAVPWSEIESVHSHDTVCHVELRGQHMRYQIPWRKITSPFLLEAIAQVLIEEAKRLRALDD